MMNRFSKNFIKFLDELTLETKNMRKHIDAFEDEIIKYLEIKDLNTLDNMTILEIKEKLLLKENYTKKAKELLSLEIFDAVAGHCKVTESNKEAAYKDIIVFAIKKYNIRNISDIDEIKRVCERLEENDTFNFLIKDMKKGFDEVAKELGYVKYSA